MIRAHDQGQRLGVQKFEREPPHGLRVGRPAEDEVEFARAHRAEEGGVRARADLYADVWAPVPKPGDRAGQQGARDGGQGADPHRGNGRLSRSGQHACGGCQRIRDLDGTTQEFFPGPREPGAVPSPVHEARAGERFELVEGLGDRRLAQVQPGGSPAEVALLGDGDETRQVT